jgi:hypothetical protein
VPHLSTDILVATLRLLDKHDGNITDAAMEEGVPRETFRHRVKAAELRGLKASDNLSGEDTVAYPELVSDDVSAEELLAHRAERFKRRQAAVASRDWMKFKVGGQGPFGLAFVGDPHLDSGGLHAAALLADCKLLQETPRLWGVGLGDYTNNWSNRLVSLYAESEVTQSQSFMLAEWLFSLKKTDGSSVWWLLIKGNHDLWSGGRDPLDWMRRGAAPLEDWKANIIAVCPGGREVPISVSHDWKGSSIYNPLHGPMRRAKFDGISANLYVAGHRHNWALYEAESEEKPGYVYWAARARGYKFIDSHADKMGFGSQHYGATITAIIDPSAEGPSAIRCFPIMAEAVEFLEWKLSRC